MPAKPILFCATGVLGTTGGIASANRNVLAALETLAEEMGTHADTLVLNESEPHGRRYRTFNGSKPAFALALATALPRAAIAVFDHVHIAVPLLYVPRALRPPVLIHAHGSEAGKRMRPASERAFRAADLVLANSAHTVRNMRAHIAGADPVVCPLGLPPQYRLTTEPGVNADAGLVLAAADGVERPIGRRAMLLVSRLDATEREKGHRELISVMPALVARAPEAQLVLAGGGSDETELRRIAAQSPAAAGIFVTGRVPGEVLDELYRSCYAFVMPSRQEGFGLVYLEAMNHAKPCIACRNDGGAEVVADGITGLLVDQPIDLAQLTRTLSRLLNDEAMARRMGVAGWHRLHERFTAGAHQARVAHHVRALLAQSQLPGERRPAA
jgi:phosphatidylinositol alpha-1,6-mannosyltransferase